MAVSLALIAIDGGEVWCRREGDALLPLTTPATTTAEILSVGAAALAAAPTRGAFAIEAARFLSPVTRPRNLVCQGLNYKDHSSESGHEVRGRNLLFAKAPSSVSGPFQDVVRPADCQLLDYEVELGLVLDRALAFGAIVTEETLEDYVGGLVVCNDISARDIMFGEAFLQWYRGKSGRTFSPCGPWLVVPEVGELGPLLETLELRLWLNGELRQQAFVRDMIFKPHDCLTDIATFMEMEPGDLVMTGTPGGVLAQGSPELVAILSGKLFNDEARRAALIEEMLSRTRYLQPGDVVRASISTPGGEGLGTQEFKIIQG